MSASLLAVALLTAPVDLRWRGADGCPDAAAVRARLAELVPDGTSIAAEVAIEAQTSGYRAQVTVTGGQGTITRTIVGRSCATLADAAAMVIAVHADALAATAAPRVRAVMRVAPVPVVLPEPMPTRSPSPAGGVATPSVAAAPAPARAESGPHLALRIASGVSLRQTPSPSPIAIAGVGMWWNRVRVDVELGWTFAARARLSGVSAGKGADIGIVHGAVRVGWMLRRGRFELPLSGGLAAGDMVANGTGLARNRTRHDAWVAVLADVGLVFAPIPAIALFVAPQLAVSAVRPRFVVDTTDGPRALYRPPVIGARLTAGLEVRLR